MSDHATIMPRYAFSSKPHERSVRRVMQVVVVSSFIGKLKLVIYIKLNDLHKTTQQVFLSFSSLSTATFSLNK